MLRNSWTLVASKPRKALSRRANWTGLASSQGGGTCRMGPCRGCRVARDTSGLIAALFLSCPLGKLPIRAPQTTGPEHGTHCHGAPHFLFGTDRGRAASVHVHVLQEEHREGRETRVRLECSVRRVFHASRAYDLPGDRGRAIARGLQSFTAGSLGGWPVS